MNTELLQEKDLLYRQSDEEAEIVGYTGSICRRRQKRMPRNGHGDHGGQGHWRLSERGKAASYRARTVNCVCTSESPVHPEPAAGNRSGA